ncbi:hypothetical protein FB45DRAFT_897535 [Roridomyces roridus]|uniref:F-box domain-containing protein n=1 Tax=Roridomyces roridus TaxID=1738132 RepID=A0AAD7CBH7_9AGAR|nr:hypothetical protein FB45DRAFT_897535 [Roridomyces roridus]
MALVELPAELLIDFPQYLHSLEDLLSLFSTCRTLYNACSNPDPKIIPHLAAQSGRVFFRPHPHLLILATARQVADWAVQADDRRYRLEVAIHGGVDKLLELALDVAQLTMDDIRRLYTYKCDVLNPLNRQLDVAAGPSSSPSPLTVCNDPETALLSWAIYGELFHHSYDLLFQPLPELKPLSSLIRYKWFVYCMPDANSFHYMCFTKSDIPAFFKEYDKEDRYQQLSMTQATENFLDRKLWQDKLGFVEDQQAEVRDLCISCVMHMGWKSLEILVKGGPERLRGEVEQMVEGIHRLLAQGQESADRELRKVVGDPWLHTAYISLEADLHFTLWSSWGGDEDDEELIKAISSAPAPAGT